MTLQTVADPRLHTIPLVGRRAERVPTDAAGVMSINVVTAMPDEDVTAVARRMLAMHLKHVPIVSGRTLVGIVSRRDILKVLARSDDGIRHDLQGRLDNERLLLGPFRADVRDGVATLHGSDDLQTRRFARLIARGVPGVVQVRFNDRE